MSEIADFLLARLAEDERALPADDSGKRSTSIAWWSNDFEVVFIEEDRWRAEVEAKRRIVERFVRGDTDDLWGPEIGALLALPYADHPDYRQEWRP